MPTPLKDRVRSAAIAYPGFTALLGTNPFRWYDQQLPKGAELPAVTVMTVSNAPTYAIVGVLPTSFARLQFTIWGVNTALGMSKIAAVEALLTPFLDQLNLVDIPGLCSYSNRIVAARDGWFPTPEPGNPQRLVDAFVYSNDSL